MPEFDPTLGSVLQSLGIPGVFIVLVLTALALDSWASNVRRAYRSARTVGTAASHGCAWLFRQPAARAFILIVASAVVLTVQAIMVLKISYAGGSFIATAFDPTRRAAFDAAFEAKPGEFGRGVDVGSLDPAIIASFSKLDMVSGVYMALSAWIIVLSYGKGRNRAALPMALILSLPYSLFLGGAIVVVGFVAAVNALTVFLALLVGESQDWSFTKEHVDSNIAIVLGSGFYCLAAFTAVSGACTLRTLWTISGDADDASV